MSYLARVIQPGETVIYTTKLHWLIYLRAIVLLIVAVIVLIVSSFLHDYPQVAMQVLAALLALLALASGFRAFLRRSTTELAITDHRVIYKTGLVARHTLEMNRSKVESVDVDQTILGRVFSYGTIIVRGTGGSLEPIRMISDPLAFRSHITAG